MMDNNNKAVRVGNENFKEWLRTLDPNTRVVRISDIAHTLSKMSLRGSEIKAALTQLSQRCQVMLVRLTANQIKHYTRRKPLQKLQHLNPVLSSSQHEGDHHTSMTSVTAKEDKQSSSGNDLVFPAKYDGKTIYDHVSPKASSVMLKSTPEQIGFKKVKFADAKRKKQKKKELLKELFGEDDTEDVSSKALQQTQKTSNVSSDKEVNNYLSTTVNVNYYNIYNGTPSSGLASNSSAAKRKSHTENTLIKSSSDTQKRLRIDVSLGSNQSSDIRNKKPKESVEDLDLVESQKGKTKKSSNKHSKRRSSSGKKKPKKDRKKLSKNCLSTTNVTSTEEDPSIKELWSILGMESPTDRTAKFLSNCLNFSSSEKLTLHAAAEETNSTDSFINVPLLSHNAHVNTIDAMTETGTESVANPADISQCRNTGDEDGPCIQISEAFSLAEMNTQVPNDIYNTATNPSRETTEQVVTICNEGKKDMVSNKEGGNPNVCVVPENFVGDTSLVDNNGGAKSKQPTQDNTQKKQLVDEISKIGKIRVKSLGLLMDPQLQSTTIENIASKDKNMQSSTGVLSIADISDQSHRSSDLTEQSFEERFHATYAHYFDELVEAKIPKLGELLHLAIADAIRWAERIKRAQQLSSEDLIKEEKERAEKDFNDMMKIRGVEFTPLCDIIIKRFEPMSKVTLFYALFCRILKHAGTIDPGNEKHVLKAKRVITTMMKKHQYKDKDILEALQSYEDDFVEQATEVGQLVAKCIRFNDKAATAANPLTDSCNNVTSDAPPISEVSQGKDNYIHPHPTIRIITGENYKRLQRVMMTSEGGKRPNNEQNKTIALAKQPQNSNRNISSQITPINLNILNIVPKRVIPSEMQQPLTHQQTNPTIDNRMNHQETPHVNAGQTPPKTLLINYLQNAFDKKCVNRANMVNNQNSLLNQNQANIKVRPRPSIRITNIPLDQNRYTRLRQQLSSSVSNKEMQTRINYVTPQMDHALPTSSAISGRPDQLAAIPSSNYTTFRVSSAKMLHNSAVLTSTTAASTTNTEYTSAPPQYSSPRQPTSTLAQSVLNGVSTSTTLPGGASISTVRQQSPDVLNTPVLQHPMPDVLNTPVLQHPRPDVLNTPVLQHPRPDLLNTPKIQQPTLDQAKSVRKNIIVRKVVDPDVPAVVGIDPNQLRMPRVREESITSMSCEPNANDRGPITSAMETVNNTSSPASAGPEVTSPNTELNLPSSSHCHPFIARRPISGKMKMLFGNNSNN